MKLTLFFLFSLLCINSFAQNCSNHILFKKGVQLEYNYFMAQLSGASQKNARIQFEVTDITERDGSTFSSIIKRGISEKDEKGQYQRRIVLKCDGKNVHIPFDFYSPDTVYTRDAYPDERKDKKGAYAFAYTPLEDAITYIVPLVLEGIRSLDGTKQFEQKVKRRHWTEDHGLIKSDFESITNIKSMHLKGTETVKTEAGVFECYKFYVDSDMKSNKHVMQVKYWLYINKELGLVKYDGPGGVIELTSVKK
jgi:hypothetical protein